MATPRYTTTWLWFLIGGAAYQGIKSALGFEASLEAYLGSAYWTGAALFTHYYASKN